MNAQIRSLITDIKAAARIGHAESLWVALDGLLDLPQVAGNPPMNDAFIEKVILLIGEALSNPRLNLALIRPLANEPQAALRACIAAALAYRFLASGKITTKDLSKLGKDPRQDVRQALRVALAHAGQNQPENLSPLIDEWLNSPSPRLQAIAIALLPNIPAQALSILAEFDAPSDPEVRAALVDTLSALANAGHAEEVLALLTAWSRDQDNNIWTICKTLAGSWAAQYPRQALDIIHALHPKSDNPKQLINTLQALHRHGAERQTIDALKTWLKSGSPALQKLAGHVLDKIE